MFLGSSIVFYIESDLKSMLCRQKSDWILGDNDHSDDSTYELCEVMYDTSAKCNKYLATDNDYEVRLEMDSLNM